MVVFTNDMGMTEEVDAAEVMTLQETPEFKVVQARSNPSGQLLTKVIYNNPRNNVGGMGSFDPFELEQSREGMPEPDDNIQYGRVMENDPKHQSSKYPMGARGFSSQYPPCNACNGTGDSPIDDGKCTVCDGYGKVEEGDQAHAANPGGVSAAGSGVISWRNLRLSAAIQGSRQQILGKTTQRVRKYTNIGAALGKINPDTSIRNHPELMSMATAEHWFDYIRNLGPIDVGAELSAEVSPQEQLGVYHFLKEWEMDPTHRGFRNRVNNGADADSELAKGQIVYDIMSSRGPDPMKSVDFSKHKFDKMFRLAMDILSSIRLNTYNYYTINRMHVQEGDRIFMDFRSRYVPLGAQEVSMVTEMQSNISDSRSYAFQTTASETQAIEADQLMRKAVSSYQVGDTRTTKSILEVLMAPPFSYSPVHERITASHVQSSETTNQAKFAVGEVFRAQWDKAVPEAVKPFLDGNSIIFALKPGTTAEIKKIMTDKGSLVAKPVAGTELIVLDGFHTRKPVGILKASNAKNPIWDYNDYDGYMSKGVKTFEDKGQRDQKRKLQDAVKPKSNPKYSVSKKGGPQKRGKFLFMEIHHKNKLEMKRKASGQHGASKNTAKWSKGLNRVFPGLQLVQTGTLKSTGEEAPYRIRLPTTHFKRVTHPTTGKPTIGIKKGDAKLKTIWQNLLDTYGMPKHTPDKGTHHRYIIPVNQQGSYQDEVRRKVGKAKAGR